MADVILFRDTFDGPAGPVDEGRTPDVGAYEFLDGGELDGNGTLTCDGLSGVGSATPTPDPAATYRAATEFLTTGGLGGVELGAGAGKDTYFWAEIRFVPDVGLVISSGDPENSFDDVPVSAPGDAVPLSIEVGPSGTDISYMGDVVATFPTFTSASLSGAGAGLYVGAFASSSGGAVVLNYVELIQSAPTDGGSGGSPPTAPLKVGVSAGFDSSWEAAQEVAGALPAPGWSASEGFLGGANAPTGARPVTAQVGVSGATWTSFKREYWV